MSEVPVPLLAAGEPPPVALYNATGPSPFLLVTDHAGNRMPRALGRLGIAQAECERHIAWDIGIAGLGRLLADALGAMLIQQNYSRLVIDCNRPPGSAASIPEISELTPIPGNVGVTEIGKAARAREIFWPYHQRIETELDRRKRAGRSWHAALLYNRDPRLARSLLALLKEEPGLIVGDNEPYSVTDATDYTIPVHGERRGLPHALIELRQDLIAEESAQRRWADLLTRLLPQAYESLAAA
jgi:predicted N-formylglutamate amidohydrolase